MEVDPNRSRTASRAASTALAPSLPNGSTSWAARSSSRLPSATPRSVMPDARSLAWRWSATLSPSRGSSGSARSPPAARVIASLARNRRSAAEARPCGRFAGPPAAGGRAGRPDRRARRPGPPTISVSARVRVGRPWSDGDAHGAPAGDRGYGRGRGGGGRLGRASRPAPARRAQPRRRRS